jgi:cobalamin biosynthesis protein CobD/CbiB
MANIEPNRNLRPSAFVAPVPATPAEWVRKVKFNLTLNDHVENIHKDLIEEDNAKYIAYLQACFDAEAEEGSLAADNHEAARMIRERAETDNNPAKGYKIATIAKALNIVLKRYGVSRKQRKNTVGGEYVAPEGSSDNNGE